MKKIYRIIGLTPMVVIPTFAIISCNKNETNKIKIINANQEKANQDLKIIKKNLNLQILKRLLTAFKDQEVKVLENIKKEYENKKIIPNKNINTIRDIKSSIEGVKFDNEKISFKISIEYLQEGIKYHIEQIANNSEIKIIKQDDAYVPVIEMKTIQTNYRINDANGTKMSERKHYVLIRDVFGSWDDNLKDINHDQDNGVVKNIKLIHTNDTHGHMKEDGGKYNKFTGMSGLAAYVKEQKPDLLLSGGDFMQGTGISNYDHGQRAMRIASLLGFDAIAAGNHEFDWGYKTLVGRAKKAPVFSDNTFYNKQVLIKKYVDSESSKDSKPYDIEGVKQEHVIPGIRVKFIKGNLPVGIISLTTPDVDTKVNPVNVDDVQVELLSQYTQKEINNLRAAGVKLIIIVGHMGNEPSSVETSEKLIKKIEGVDLVIDGHSHQLYKTGKTFKDKNGKDIPIGQTGAYTRNIGVMTFDFDKKTGQILNYKNKYVNYEAFKKLNLSPVQSVEDIIKEADQEYEKYAGQSAFTLNKDLTDSMMIDGKPTRTVRKFETSAGNFFADGILWSAIKNFPVDATDPNQSINLSLNNTIGFINGGGVRASVKAGPTKKKDWIDMSPFNNSLSVIKVSGKSIWAMFNHSIKSWNDGPFAQVSKNVEIKFEVYKDQKDNEGNEVTSSNKVTSIKINNKDVKNDDFQTFYVVGNDFLRNGGDGYKEIWSSPQEVHSGGTLSDILIAYGEFLQQNIMGSKFSWNDYPKSEIRPNEATRLKVVGKDTGAQDFIAKFNI